jgi:hypothetical protein
MHGDGAIARARPAAIAHGLGDTVQRDELDMFDFLPPDELGSVLNTRLARRVLACLSLHGRGALYLEDGVPG